MHQEPEYPFHGLTEDIVRDALASLMDSTTRILDIYIDPSYLHCGGAMFYVTYVSVGDNHWTNTQMVQIKRDRYRARPGDNGGFEIDEPDDSVGLALDLPLIPSLITQLSELTDI